MPNNNIQNEKNELLKFLQDFLNENMGNKYGPTLSKLLFINIETGLKKIEEKYNVLAKQIEDKEN